MTTAAAIVLAAATAAVGWDLYLDLISPVVPAPEGEPTVIPTTGPPAIAVLPFDNMSGDPDQEYFSDGITDDLIIDMSHVSGLFVIARNSVFTYKGRAVNVQQVGRELGVAYVLEGSVRKVGDRVRINAQLVDATTGRHLWAERYDRELDDVFALQDEVVQKIVAALAVKLTAGEEERLSRSAKVHPEAYDTLLRGLAQYHRYTRGTNVEARKFFEQAIALDPRFARAYADLALTHVQDVEYGWSDNPQISIEKALKAARRALALNESVPQVHFALSNVYLFEQRHEDAITAAHQAIEIDPNYADGHVQLAFSLNYAGRPQEALEAMRKAARLDPRQPFFHPWIRGHSHFLMGQYEDAIPLFEEVVRRNPQLQAGHVALAAAYAQQGRIEDAEWEAVEILTLLPDFTLAGERQRAPYKRAEDEERWIEGLRKAGLPE